MAIWKYSAWDAVMFILSISHTVATVTLVMYWDHFTIMGWLVNIVLLTLMTTYNIIVISHFFTHTPWFVSRVMNMFVSILNSMNIGQSVQSYHLSHVRNHHKYNNDRGVGESGPLDTSSTFINGEHSTLWYYTLHLSSCCFVGCFHSPQSHSYLCSWGFVHLPPRCNSKSIRYILSLAQHLPFIIVLCVCAGLYLSGINHLVKLIKGMKNFFLMPEPVKLKNYGN